MFKTKLQLIFLALIFLGLFGLAESSRAADYYVSPTGAAAWVNCGAPAKSGTVACSWQTAMANAVAGDMVYFRGGVYEPGEANQFGDPKMRPANDGTAESPLTLKAFLGETPIIHDAMRTGVFSPSNNTGTAAGCYRNSYVVWDGFTFDRVNNNGYQASAIMRFESSDHCSVINSDFIGRPQLDQYNGAFIHIVQSSYIYISNNRLHGMSCGISPVSACVNATAIWSFDFDHVYIDHNDFYDNVDSISTKIGTDYLYIFNNHIWDCGGSAFWNGWQFSDTTDEIIYQNVIRNCPLVLDATNAGDRMLYNLKFFNNTVYNSGTGMLATIGHINYQGWRGSEVFNNIIYNAGGGNPLLVRYFNESPDDMPSYANYNAYYGGGYWNLNYNDAYNYNTLGAWNSATGLDGNSITSNPLFVNAGGINPADYKLQTESPARIGRGGAYASVMGAYITGSEVIGYVAPAQTDVVAPATPTNLSVI